MATNVPAMSSSARAMLSAAAVPSFWKPERIPVLAIVTWTTGTCTLRMM